MSEHDPTLERVVETLRERVEIDPDLDRRVLAAVERLPPPARRGAGVRELVAWLRRPRTIRLSPLGGLLAAAGVAALILAGSRIAAPDAVAPSSRVGGGVEAEVLTQFVLVAPGAESVSVVGDFNDWSLSATPLARQPGDGVWWVSVPLPPGRYRYAYIVDGVRWYSDPNTPATEDEFGRPNSVVTIGGA